MTKTQGMPTKNDAVNNEIMKEQQKIFRAYQKRLSPKNLKALQAFASSGKAPGSKEFFKLDPIVRAVVMKLQFSSIDIMAKHTKNPFKKIQYWLVKTTTKQLVKDPKKKEDDKKNTKSSTKSGKSKKKKK